MLNQNHITMKKFLIIVSLLCLCEAEAYAQTSSNEKKANREKRKTERLVRRAERQEKKLKEETETGQEDLVVTVEQEQLSSTINENNLCDITGTSQEHTPDSATQVVGVVVPKEESKTESTATSTPTKNKDVDKTKPVQTTQTSNDDNTAFAIFIIIVVAIVAIPIMILKWIFSGRCKKCGKLRAMHTIDEQYLGCSKTKMEKDDQGKLYQVHYNNIKVIQRCKHCGYTTTCVEERKG